MWKWIQHVNRVLSNRLPRVMKQYSMTGRRNHGRPLKRLLDTWDGNGQQEAQLHDRYMMMMRNSVRQNCKYRDLNIRSYIRGNLTKRNVEWTDMIYVKWFSLKWSEVKWSEVKLDTVKVLGRKVKCTLVWPWTEGIWLYCDYFIWCVSRTVVVLTFFKIWLCVLLQFVMCVCVFVWVF